MGFWSSETIKNKIQNDLLIKDLNLDSSKVVNCSYQLALGEEVYINSHGDGVKQKIEAGGQISIPSGQFAILLTEEKVAIPLDAIGLISIRTSRKAEGLLNVSGFHVDPGFQGKLKFTVYNAGPKNIVLQRGDAIFVLWFCSLDKQTADGYTGKCMDQANISSEDSSRIQGKIPSPSELQQQIEKVQHSIDSTKHSTHLSIDSVKSSLTLLTGLALTAIAVLLGGFYFYVHSYQANYQAMLESNKVYIETLKKLIEAESRNTAQTKVNYAEKVSKPRPIIKDVPK